MAHEFSRAGCPGWFGSEFSPVNPEWPIAITPSGVVWLGVVCWVSVSPVDALPPELPHPAVTTINTVAIAKAPADRRLRCLDSDDVITPPGLALTQVRPGSRVTAPPHPAIRPDGELNASNHRIRWWSEQPTSDMPEQPGPDPTQRVDEAEALRLALNALSPPNRAAVVFRYYAQLSEAETAQALGIPPGTVKSRLSRALAQLSADPHLADLQTEARHE